MWAVSGLPAYVLRMRPRSIRLSTALLLGSVSACFAACSCDPFPSPDLPAPPPPPAAERSTPVPQEVPGLWVDKEQQANITSPIVLVPGILGSFPKNPDDIEEQADIKDGMRWQLTEEAFANQYGALARHSADVFVHIRQRLMAKGYQPDVSLFAAAYDWRRSIAERDSLHRWLKYAISTFNLKTGGSASSVDVVAHSMGGLVVRNYIQSSSDQVPDGKVEIRAFAIVASPQFGAADAYHTWAGGFVPPGSDPGSAKFLSGLLQRMNAKIRPEQKRTIRTFVREYVQSVRDLLPVPETDQNVDGYLFGWPGGGSRTPFVKMRDENRNKIMEQLNDQLKMAPLPGTVAIFLASGVKTLQEVEVARPATPELWEDGEPTPRGQKFADGDGRVLFRQDLMGRLARVLAVAPSEHQRAVCVFTPDLFKFLGIPVVAADTCRHDMRAPKPILAVTFTTTTSAELAVKDPKGYVYTNAEFPTLRTARSRHFHVEVPPEGVYEIGVAGDPGEHFVFLTSVTGPFAENSVERAFKFVSKTQETWQVELKQGLLAGK